MKKGVIFGCCPDVKSDVRGRRGRSARTDERREGAGAGSGWKTGMETGTDEKPLKNEKLKVRRVTLKRDVFASKEYH